jgi:peptidoglycan/xylan/chitin deacetylase (PgdA/CDA1 family)
MATVRAGVVPLLRAVGRVSVWIGLVVFHAVQRLSQVVMAIAWRVAKPRVERLRTRYWFNLLDAVVTSSVLPVQGASLRRVFTPLRQANFKRLQHAVVALEARWPSLAQRLRDSVMRDDLLPFAAFLDPRPFAHGWNSTVYRLRLRDSTDLEGPEAVLKVVRNSLGRATPQLLEQVRVARSRYEKLTRWYGEAMLPRTRFFVLQAPLLGAPAIAILQPRLPGQPKDLFALEDDEILRLVARHVELRGQFRHFVARTIESVEQTSLCPDLMGRRNVLVVESLQGPRLSIVDTGLKDLAQLERERPDIVRQVRIRLARLERLRDAMDRAARDRSGIDGIGHAKFLPDAENERERAALRVMPAAARRLIVLTYHRVLDAGEQGLFNPSLVSTTPSMFEWQMRKVARDYRVVSLHDVLEAFRGGRPLPTRAVLITFDDGYRDFGEVAWPILRRLGLPAALFVPTGYPDRPDRRFWWDRLAAAFQRADPRALSALLGGSTIVYWPEGWRRALRDVVAQLKSLPHAQAMMVVESVLSRLGEQKLSPRSSVLGWSELRELAREGVSMCPHSRNHAALTRLPLSAARAEVRDSVEDLRREIGSAPPAFAYPFGDHDPTIVELDAAKVSAKIG